GPSGAGPYTYTVERDKDGSGRNLWYAGDAVFNTGNTGDGFIDLYSVHGIKAPTEYGPSIVGNARNSTTYNDWSEHWAIGNLNGIYGYAATTYGVAFGEYSATKAYMTIDSTNGIRMMANNVLMGQWQPGGDVIFGQVATNKANLFWDQSEGKLNFRGGANGTASAVRIDAGGGITLIEGASDINAIKWDYSGSVFGKLWGRYTNADLQLCSLQALASEFVYSYIHVTTRDNPILTEVILKSSEALTKSTRLVLTATSGVLIEAVEVNGSADLTVGGGLNVGTTGAGTGCGSFAASNAGGTQSLSISNTETANAASNALLEASVGGTSAGDPLLRFVVQGVGGWLIGLDNNDSDKLKFSSTWNDLAGGAKVTITTAGAMAVVGCVTDGTCEIFNEDALSIIKDIRAHGTGRFDKYGHEHFDLAWMFGKYPFLAHEEDGKHFDRLGAKSDLLYRAAIQLDDHRLAAEAQREAIRAEIAKLQEQLDKMERRG
ncbi:MAG TPA: hypothetical protein VM537_02615, partial [Anaerolineae bacterium]|nr:hypothetical protein [Anaerolineae bacterium]